MFIVDNAREDTYTCTHSKPLPDAITTPYAFQQIALLSNYSVIP